MLTAGGLAIAAGRLSFTFGMNGPCLTIDTASSSALAACSLAVRSLQDHDCPVANVSGTHIMFHPDTALGMMAIGLLSPKGRCFTWDSRAQGIVFGEATIAVTLSNRPSSSLAVRQATVRQGGY